MLLSSSCVAAALAFAASVDGRTPPNTQPSTTADLWVKFGNVQVKENELLSKQATAEMPTIAVNNSKLTQTYSLLMIDLSIPLAGLTPNQSSDPAPGLGQNRTTRLHWWSTNVTQVSDGTLNIPTSSNAAVAPYNGPAPPAGDIPHTYVVYLLPGEFVEEQQYRQFLNASSGNRNNFNLPGLMAQTHSVGGPIAAQYFQVQVCNATQTQCATATQTADSTSSTPTPFMTSAAVRSFVDNPTWWAVLAGVGAMAAFVM